MPTKLEGKIVLVTGALTGIGRAAAITFAEEGAKVVVSGRREKEGQELAAELQALGAEAVFVRTDVRNDDDVRVMLPRRSGSIVNVSSAYGSIGAAGASVYVASKHAVEGLTKSAALEVAGTGVRVNVVAPGATDTGMLTRFTSTDKNKTALVSTVPVKRMATPEEIAQAIAFVASSNASYMTGASIPVDGGLIAG
jgi:NAD(P)-dependent dehydrogenase (short-subunit alcohol dehydrogenase family)